ncbi:MAG: hypothetical protein ABIH72_05135 [archaeon]
MEEKKFKIRPEDKNTYKSHLRSGEYTKEELEVSAKFYSFIEETFPEEDCYEKNAKEFLLNGIANMVIFDEDGLVEKIKEHKERIPDYDDFIFYVYESLNRLTPEEVEEVRASEPLPENLPEYGISGREYNEFRRICSLPNAGAVLAYKFFENCREKTEKEFGEVVKAYQDKTMGNAERR